MISLLWTVIRSNLPASFMTGIAFLLLLFFAVERHEITSLKRNDALCQSRDEALTLSNSALLASLRHQNDAITMLNLLMQQKKAEADKAMKIAQTRSIFYRNEIQKIHAAAPGNEKCAQLTALLRQFSRPGAK